MKALIASVLLALFAAPALAQGGPAQADIYDPGFIAQVKAVAPQAIKQQVRTVAGPGKNVVRTVTVEYVDLTALTLAMMQHQQMGAMPSLTGGVKGAATQD